MMNMLIEEQLTAFFKEIKDLYYVVQRNWENLPHHFEVDGHGDLDLFATDDHKHKILGILQKYPDIKCDVRSQEDDYYPFDLGDHLLSNRLDWNAREMAHMDFPIYIPNDQAAFEALFYHNMIHKQDDSYKTKLRAMFKRMYPPVKCKDEGVGYYDFN